GAYPTLPNSKVVLPAASMMPWKEAMSPSKPIPISSLYKKCPSCTTLASANGKGESDGSVLPGGYTTASHPPTPMAVRNVRMHRNTNVPTADPNPISMFLCGLIASSATLATPSMARKNQIANGMAAKAPDHPFGRGFILRLLHSKEGIVAPANINSSITARMVITNSKEAASLTPRMLIKVKMKYAITANTNGGIVGYNRLRYAPMAAEIAGGAKMNSMF